MSHGDRVEEIPSGFSKLQLVKTLHMQLLLILVEIFMLFQFHPEVYHQNVVLSFLKTLQNIFVVVGKYLEYG